MLKMPKEHTGNFGDMFWRQDQTNVSPHHVLHIGDQGSAQSNTANAGSDAGDNSSKGAGDTTKTAKKVCRVLKWSGCNIKVVWSE